VRATSKSNEIEVFLSTVAQSPLSALLLDYDGTLAPFSVDRRRAVPYPGVDEILQDIVDTGRTRLIIMTGREAHDVKPLLKVRPFPEVWGAHGLQRLSSDGGCQMPEVDPDALQALADAERWLAYQGLDHMAEPKPGSLAVHWRALDHNSAVRLRGKILLGWFPIAQRASLRVLEFDGGLELRIPDQDKSDAIKTILRELGPESPIAYLGDDVTDETAFRALQDRGLTVLVRKEHRKTSARVWLKPPEELLDFLAQWRNACRTTSLARSASYSR
jgi:trehalose 6-phosphate phosphatase